MSDYKRFLTNKQVVLVGPASTLRGTKMGPTIDAYDVVVRINHAWPLPKDLQDDIGQRLDVLYHNLNPRNQPLYRRHVLRMRRDGVKWVVSSHPATRVRFRRRQQRFRRINKGAVKFRVIPQSIKTRLRRKVGSSNSGLAAIVDLLRYPIKSLYVTGFSFYSTPYLKYPSYRPSFRKKAVEHHNQRRHKTYMAQLVARERRLAIDPVMTELLKKHMKQVRQKR